MEHGGSTSSVWEVEKYSQGCLETPQLTKPFFIHFVPSFWGGRVLQMPLWSVWIHVHCLKYIIYTNTEFLVAYYGQICSQCNLNTTKCKKFFFCYLLLKQNLKTFNENSFRGTEITLGNYLFFISVIWITSKIYSHTWEMHYLLIDICSGFIFCFTNW